MSRNGELSVVLVHGAWVDGAGWESVYKAVAALVEKAAKSLSAR